MTLALIASFALASNASDERLAALAELMAGEFDTHVSDIAIELRLDQRLIDSRQRVNAPELGETVFYLQLNRGTDLALYRQRMLILTLDSETSEITQRAYSIRDAVKYADASANDALFGQLRRADLTPLADEGCEQIWTFSDGAYVGIVNPENCIIISSRTGKRRKIGAVSKLTADTLSLAERGFDADGVQLFGTPPGESLLLYRTKP